MEANGDESLLAEDQNQSSSSSSTSEDLEPMVRDQFVKLATALKETNQNLLTFEFMLGQYRRLARIEPFQVTRPDEGNDKTHDHDKPGRGNSNNKTDAESGVVDARQTEMMLDQLRTLAKSVEQLSLIHKPPEVSPISVSASGDENDVLLAEVRSMREQLAELRTTQATATQLTAKVMSLEAALEEKSKLCERLGESHSRLTAQLSEERDRREQLDKKLETEKRAAAQVGKDIEKYVRQMGEFELRVRTSDEKVTRLKNDNESLTKQLAKEKEELGRCRDELAAKLSHSTTGHDSSHLERLRELEARVRMDAETQENLRTTIDILQDQLVESRRLAAEAVTSSLTPQKLNNTSVMTSSFTDNDRLCSTCMNNSNSSLGGGHDRLEEAARKVQDLAVDIQQRTEKDINRLSVQNQSYRERNEALESALRREQNLRSSLEAKVIVCENEIRSYELQVKEWKDELKTLQHELERCHQQQQLQPEGVVTSGSTVVTSSAAERREKRRLERDFRALQLTHADTLATKEQLASREEQLSSEVTLLRDKLANTEEALSRLKGKSKILLRRYQTKKQICSELTSKLETVRQCLYGLRDLCQTKEENFRDILDHLGSQIQISARLVAAYLNVTYNFEILSLTGNVSMVDWFTAVQALSSWTHKQLMVFGAAYWTSSTAATLPQMMTTKPSAVDVDTLSEISQMLEVDSEKEKSVRSLVEAQDRISRTEQNSFSVLFARAKAATLPAS